ncbi:HEPHL-like protein, partial [Mya arenaria]
TSRRLIENRDDQIGSVYRKVLYREYTDETFTQQVHVPDWMVYVGPFVKAEEADSVKILFKNMASKGNFSIHPHGFFYDKRGEGARYEDGTSGADKVDDAMRPAGSYLYIWNVTKRHAPTADDDACVPSGNHGHTNPTRDIASGLAGIGFICKKGTLDVDGKRKDVDKEFVVYVDIADENKSFFFEESIQKCRQPDACQARADAGDEDFGQSNEMHHINGYVYGNQPPFKLSPGDRAVFYVITEYALVNSASFLSAYTVACHPGHWLLYCRILDHRVCLLSWTFQINQYFRKSLVKVEATEGYLLYMSTVSEEIKWFLQTENKLQTVHELKLSNSTFTTSVTRGDKENHSGFTGPNIKGEVADTILFELNNKASREYSFLAGGVSMSKENEGAVYKQSVGATTSSGATVEPGATYMYEFFVSSINAPTKIDSSCLTYI